MMKCTGIKLAFRPLLADGANNTMIEVYLDDIDNPGSSRAHWHDYSGLMPWDSARAAIAKPGIIDEVNQFYAGWGWPQAE